MRLRTFAVFAPATCAVAVSFIGPWLAPHRVTESIVSPYSEPGGPAPFGGDILGRDVWSQLLHGGWGLILISAIIAVLVTGLAAILGAVAALRPRIRTVVEQATDMLILLPPVLGILVIMLSWPQSREFGLILIAVCFGTPYCARVFEAAAAGIVASGYMQVSMSSGETLPYLVFSEVLPNMRSTLLTQLGLRFVNAMYLVSTAAFLQLSTTLGESNWAVMVRDNASGILLNPWAVVAPSLAIAVVAVSVNLAIASLQHERSAYADVRA